MSSLAIVFQLWACAVKADPPLEGPDGPQIVTGQRSIPVVVTG
jgi:hypothetical protein